MKAKKYIALLDVALMVAALFAALVIAIIVSSSLQRGSPTDAQLEKRSGIERVRIPGLGVVDYEFILEARSEPNETMDEFAVRLGSKLREFSDRTGYEACGVIATDGERFGTVIGSNRSHVACANFSSKVPEGMRATDETIHSHGLDKSFNANRNDLVLQGQAFHGRPGLRGVGGQDTRRFSEMDYEGGPGYLATPNGVIHQRGQGTTRTVSGP